MANTTARTALSVHGTNPQFLVEKTVRARIYDSVYWKEHCFALTAETLIDKAVDLQYVGGLYGLQRASPYLCLVQKLLQLQPEREILVEYLNAHEFKYLRAVAAMYIRLTFRAVDVYELLEPLLNDYRKLRWRDMAGSYSITHMDSFVDSLLRESRVCDVSLPLLTRRDVVEELEGLAPRVSRLEDVLLHQNEHESDAESDDSAAEARRERRRRVQRAARIRQARANEQPEPEQAQEIAYTSQEEDGEGENTDEAPRYVSRSPSRSISISPDRQRNEDADADADADASYKSRSPSRSPDGQERYMSRSPSRSPDRD